jgi:uncharacterized protein YjbI with pentapeptide repeats
MQSIVRPHLPSELAQLDNLRKALRRDESLSSFIASNQDLSAAKAKTLIITEARLEKVNASEANFEKLGLSDVALLRCDLTATNCAESSWRRVKLQNMRCSGLKLQTSTLKDVVFEDCKLDLSNFRFSKLKNVQFKDCVLDEADFYKTELENVQFLCCSLNKAEFSAAKCKDVDLRTSDLAGISGVEGLAGATIDSVQLIAIAQTLAHYFKIQVSDE